jgi:hypothetical protein
MSPIFLLDQMERLFILMKTMKYLLEIYLLIHGKIKLMIFFSIYS